MYTQLLGSLADVPAKTIKGRLYMVLFYLLQWPDFRADR